MRARPDMEARLILVVFALQAWMAAGFPVYPPHQQSQIAAAAVPRHNNLQYEGSSTSAAYPAMKESSASKHGPHFLDWLAETHPEQRDDVLRIEAARMAHKGSAGTGSSSINRFRKFLKTWSAFYDIQYPPKPRTSSLSQHHRTAMEKMEDILCAIILVDADSVADGKSTATATATTAAAIATITHCPSQDQGQPASEHDSKFLQRLQRIDIAAICSDYGPEIVALCIFLLVPLTIVLVEIIDVIHDRCVPEKFPERGRGRVRLTGAERRLSVIEKCEREKAVRDQAQKSKFWRVGGSGTRRGSRAGFTD